MEYKEDEAMKLTEFGKFSRKLRIDNGELLKDMAIKIKCNSLISISSRNRKEKYTRKMGRRNSKGLSSKPTRKRRVERSNYLL